MSKSNVIVDAGELSSYVPRHVRLSIPPNCEPSFDSFYDSVESIPIVDEKKRVVASSNRHVLVPAKDFIGKFKSSDFDISMLQAAGVPLDIVNMSVPASVSVEQIERVVTRLGSLEEYAKQVSSKRSEFESFFVSPSVSENVENL